MIERLPSKQDVVGSSPTGRAASFFFSMICARRRSHPTVCFFDRWSGMAGLWRFSSFFYRSICLREPHLILCPLRITYCHRNVMHAEHSTKALGQSYWSNRTRPFTRLFLISKALLNALMLLFDPSRGVPRAVRLIHFPFSCTSGDSAHIDQFKMALQSECRRGTGFPQGAQEPHPTPGVRGRDRSDAKHGGETRGRLGHDGLPTEFPGVRQSPTKTNLSLMKRQILGGLTS
jgi:hypothetical protein